MGLAYKFTKISNEVYEVDGFINFLKPPGMTSHDAVGFVRRVLGEKKVGHAGTLDPGAAGVLPIAVGKATRLIEYFDSVAKAYRCEMLLGLATDSGDDSGNVIARAENFTMPVREQIEAVMTHFTGRITQIPPVFSAVKIKGRRACDLVREGIQAEIPSRQVEIYSIKLIQAGARHILFDVSCSKGTYIRSLCRDMGEYLGIPATMSFLVREQVGDFSLGEAITPEELQQLGEKALQPMDECLSHVPVYELRQERVKAFCNGLPTNDYNFAVNTGSRQNENAQNVILRVYAQGVFLGMGHYHAAKQEIIPDKIIYR